MAEPLAPATGQGVVHLFWKVPTPGSPVPAADVDAVRMAVKAAEADGVQVVPVAMLGHKADLATMALGTDLWRLRRLQTELAAAGLVLVDSYVSLTELSEYAPDTVSEGQRRVRLWPQLPPEGKTAWCFYPMSKRRWVGANWFTLPYDERRQLMLEHGQSGRKFAGRIVQLVTGSTGLDDHEWGVTLFGVHPDDLKEAVYTMRYDQASAHYGDFGTFYTGLVAGLDEVLDRVGLG
jgi:chlorite dismutase